MFDLDAIDTKSRSEAGVAMTVKKLDGSPLLNSRGGFVQIMLRGPDSTIYSQLVRAQVKKRMARSGIPTEEQSLEDEADLIDLLASCTVGWSGVLKKPSDDEAEAGAVTFSADACRDLYRAFPVIRDQVDAFIANRANFTLASSKK
jgi:hypothetical protein